MRHARHPATVTEGETDSHNHFQNASARQALQDAVSTSHKKPTRQGHHPVFFYRRGTGGPERSSNLLKVTQRRSHTWCADVKPDSEPLSCQYVNRSSAWPVTSVTYAEHPPTGRLFSTHRLSTQPYLWGHGIVPIYRRASWAGEGSAAAGHTRQKAEPACELGQGDSPWSRGPLAA